MLQACTQAAEGQRGQAQAGEPETQGCAGQDAVGHRITDQAHAPQDQKHTQRRGAASQYQTADECAAHKDKLMKRQP